MQTGSASPEKPPAAEPEAEAKGMAVDGEEQVKEEVEVDGEEEEERRGRQRGAAAGDGAAVVMVKRELLVRCMTCPLCRRLLHEATTISECLHTCE
jgi:E3 ubiquitin-protein ligase DRIP